MKSEVFNVDCMEFMKGLPDKCFSIGIADPPYGLDKKSTQGAGKLKNRTLNKHDMTWDVRPPQSFFDELRRVCQHVIIWGGNYFNLGPCRCFVCWDKQQVWPNFSQCEFAWTDFDKPAKHVTISNRGGHIDSVDFHPTAKPVELYTYLLKTFGTPDMTVFDPMMGSGSSRIAAYQMNYDFVGCELNPTYYKLANERFDRECLGITSTKDGKQIIQLKMFEK